METNCENCGNEAKLTPYLVQRPRGYIKLDWCKKCIKEHEKHLENLRENYRFLTGNK